MSKENKYKHYKGGIYILLHYAIGDGGAEYVVYQSIDTGLVFVREKNVFFGKTNEGLDRFAKLKNE